MKNIVVLLVTGLTCIGCTLLDGDSTGNVTKQAIISTEMLKGAPADPLTINNLEIVGDSLLVNFSAGGCNGNSWDIKFIADELVAESLPPQREVRLSLNNVEPCDAFITKDVTFDISNLQIESEELQLNIVNTGESILYEY